ncbi:hypothetical protein BLOT_004150 [Blomia tropicalis]|nr:hypothetical protein BLOT_004150 [Blomia tropicalis]
MESPLIEITLSICISRPSRVTTETEPSNVVGDNRSNGDRLTLNRFSGNHRLSSFHDKAIYNNDDDNDNNKITFRVQNIPTNRYGHDSPPIDSSFFINKHYFNKTIDGSAHWINGTI